MLLLMDNLLEKNGSPVLVLDWGGSCKFISISSFICHLLVLSQVPFFSEINACATSSYLWFDVSSSSLYQMLNVSVAIFVVSLVLVAPFLQGL